MQREEINYEAATEAGGRFSANVDDSSAPPNPTNNNHSGSLLPYHQPEAHNHGNTIILGSGSVMVDYMLSNPPPDLINNGIPSRIAYHSEQQQKRQRQQQQQHQHQQPLLLDQPNSSINCVSGGIPINMDRTLSFADVMQFADFGPKLALNHPQRLQHQENSNAEQEDDHTITGIDPVYFLKFPVLSNSHMVPGHGNTSSIHDDSNTPTNNSIDDRDGGFGDPLEDFRDREYGYDHQQEDAAAAAAAGVLSTSANNLSNPVQLEFLGNATNDDNNLMEGAAAGGTMGHINKSSSSSSKRKRPRSIKTNEEVESQRMTHIAVERNRRKQMNEHLRVLRSLMPSSYVQRGDQASIIGGAIEFVRELEQLLQCLESQKRRKLCGDQPQPMGDSSTSSSSTALGLVQQTPQVQPPLGFPPPMGSQYHHQDDDQLRLLDHQLDPMAMPTPMPMPMPMPAATGGLLREETAESKTCFADVEVKVLGFDALIKILSRRRHGQLIKAIAALEDLHFTILHTNITTIEQTVLYSFNVKVANEARFTAEDIATSVQQIFTFIHANTNII